LRPPKSIVAVPERRPCVPITQRLARKPSRPRNHGVTVSLGPAESLRASPATIFGFGSFNASSSVSEPRTTVAAIVPVDATKPAEFSFSFELHVQLFESQNDGGALSPSAFGATHVAGTHFTA
jgi:hypothetical protein